MKDSAGNQSQKVSSFFVDSVSLTVSTGSVLLGPLNANVLGQSNVVTVTVKTVGAPFSLTL